MSLQQDIQFKLEEARMLLKEVMDICDANPHLAAHLQVAVLFASRCTDIGDDGMRNVVLGFGMENDQVTLAKIALEEEGFRYPIFLACKDQLGL